MMGGEGLHAIEREGDLEVDRLLRPERPVVVEGGYPLRRLDEIRTTLSRHALHEVDDRLLAGALVP